MSRIGSWLASDTDALQLDARFETQGPAATERATLFYPCYPGNPWLNSLRCSAKKLFGFMAAYLCRVLEIADLREADQTSDRGEAALE